ncbi:hypothetical protein [Streptomyces sp. SAI-149]|uniref:hypothetical protein n=1 Tax=Streptomyces sp. SAI-149 TaxID=2940542 RepID=UPI002473A932|nr:hypothetical protein [Streptomyces sp. SAI-149]MDH6499533.1 hypothetical protein [Streptomyces sp. SAI-149]
MNPDFISAVSGAVGVAAATLVALLVARGQIRAMGEQAMMAHRAVIDGAQIQTAAADQAQAREARRAAYIPFTASAHELYELLRGLHNRDVGDLRQSYREGRASASRAAALVDLEGPEFLADLAHDVLRQAQDCMSARRQVDQILDAQQELSDLLSTHCQIEEPFVAACVEELKITARNVPERLREPVFRKLTRRHSPVEDETALAEYVEALRGPRERLAEAVGRLPVSADGAVPWSGQGLRSARSNMGRLIRYAIMNPNERYPTHRVNSPLEKLQKAVAEFVRQARACLHEEAVGNPAGDRPRGTARLTSNGD